VSTVSSPAIANLKTASSDFSALYVKTTCSGLNPILNVFEKNNLELSEEI
jgi:hypothetical protein